MGLMASLMFLLVTAGCGGNVNYMIGSDDTVSPDKRYDERYDTAAPPMERIVPPPGAVPERKPAEVGPLKLTDVTLEQGLRAIHAAAPDSPPIVALPAAGKAAEGKRVSCEFKERVSLDAALEKFLDSFSAGLGYAFQDEAYVVGLEESVQPMITVAYPVQRLLAARPDFKAPALELDRSKLFEGNSESGEAARLAGQADEESGGKNDFRSPDELINLIKSVVAPGTWGEAGEEGKGSISVSGGILTVRHTVKVQRQIARLLADLGN